MSIEKNMKVTPIYFVSKMGSIIDEIIPSMKEYIIIIVQVKEDFVLLRRLSNTQVENYIGISF